MTERAENLIQRIKHTVQITEPDAKVILYGSYARGDYKSSSDIDILILLNKTKITREEENNVRYPVYEIEFETGKIISLMVLTKSDWETRHRITPFYENVFKEGIVL